MANLELIVLLRLSIEEHLYFDFFPIIQHFSLLVYFFLNFSLFLFFLLLIILSISCQSNNTLSQKRVCVNFADNIYKHGNSAMHDVAAVIILIVRYIISVNGNRSIT